MILFDVRDERHETVEENWKNSVECDAAGLSSRKMVSAGLCTVLDVLLNMMYL